MATLLCPVCDRTVEADAEHPATRCTIQRLDRRGDIILSSTRIGPICYQCAGADEHRVYNYLNPPDGRLRVRLHVIGEEGIVASGAVEQSATACAFRRWSGAEVPRTRRAMS